MLKSPQNCDCWVIDVAHFQDKINAIFWRHGLHMEKLEFFEQSARSSVFSEELCIGLFDFSEEEKCAFLENDQLKLRAALAQTTFFADAVDIVDVRA